jgi:phosphatidylinositol-3,4,5-trisphosphate 3-phosphatase and dual-specificity protein phosphatase PTEN
MAAPPENTSMQVDVVLAMLEEKRSTDHLGLKSRSDVRSMLDAASKSDAKAAGEAIDGVGAEAAEKVIYSDSVIKVNRKGKAQSRVLLMTDRAVYNFENGKYKKPKRRILIAKMAAVSLSATGDDFVIHVDDEYDYHYRSARRPDIIRMLGVLYHERTGQQLVPHVVGIEEIGSRVMTKQLRERQEKQAQLIAQHGQQRSSILERAASGTGVNGNAGAGAGDGAGDGTGGTGYYGTGTDDGAAGASDAGSDTANAPRTTYALANMLRGLVSKKKKRFKEDGFDLDLSYITNRLIAMGYPSEEIEGLYRNPYSEVYRFLELNHRGHYKVYNLCSERKYDAAKFHYRVAQFAFDDHNCPSIQLILEFCQDVALYLAEHPENVVAIHCKAGKGRTGLMISAFLLWSESYTSADQAMHFFATQRTLNAKGVTIPSQQRYVRYFQHFLRQYYGPKRPFSFAGRPMVLHSVRLITTPRITTDGGCNPYFKVFRQSGTRMYDSRQMLAPRHWKNEARVTLPCSARVQGDCKFMFFNKDQFGSHDKMFHFWLNTNFIRDNFVVLTKFEVDKAHKDKKHRKFDEDFKVELYFRPDDVVIEKSSDGMDGKADDDDDAQDALSGSRNRHGSIWRAADVAKRVTELERLTRLQTAELELLRTRNIQLEKAQE